MSEKWDFVPEFKAAADRKGLIAELSTDSGFEFSSLTLERAIEISGEIRALGDRYEDEGPTVIGWALQWIADDIDTAWAKCTKAAAADPALKPAPPPKAGATK